MNQDSGSGRCFVTGGAGFIGSHLSERLLAAGDTVTVYDNLSSGKREWIEPLLDHPCFTFVQADLRDQEALAEAMRDHDVVIHLGANTDIALGTTKPRLDLDNCTIATFNVLEAMRDTGLRELLFASSSTIYGEIPIHPTPEDAGPVLPISLYGAAKLACEGMISAYCHLYGLRARIFRFGNVVGARMSHGVIYDFIHKLQGNPAELEILGDGHQQKNFFLVEDCIDAILFARDRMDEKDCDVYNLGTDSIVNVTEIAQIVVEEMGLSNVRFRYTGGERGWPGDVPKVVYDVGKIRALGWEARQSSADAVRIATRRLLEQQQLERAPGVPHSA